MTVASFIASQRAEHDVPHVVACRALDVSESWFYKWKDRPPTMRAIRRRELDAKVKEFFEASGGRYGSPKIHEDLIEDGWKVSEKTVADSMARQGLNARPKKKGRNLTRPDKAAEPISDLLERDFSAEEVDQKWCGDLTEIPTDEGKLYLATVEDLSSRRVPGFSMSEHHDAEVAIAAIQMAAAVRGGEIRGVIFHSDKGSEYTASAFQEACDRLGITQSMGRVGSAYDNAAAESFNSTLEFELLSRRRFVTKADARRAVAEYIDWYNRVRRHYSCEMKSPVEFEAILAARRRESTATTKAA